MHRIGRVRGVQLMVVALLLLSCAALPAQAQNIRAYYVSKSEPDGMIYFIRPQTLFRSRTTGNLTYDITYKSNREGIATLNFTYRMPSVTPADSVRFGIGSRVIATFPAQRIFVELQGREWVHRYTLSIPIRVLDHLFSAQQLPGITLYAEGISSLYEARKSRWNAFAPIGERILETIRANETR